MHAGPRSVVAKAMRLGYYWPTMHRDARDMIRTCNAFQKDQERSSLSRYGLFHKVDRGESRGNNHRQSGEEVRVGQHSMPFRSPRRSSLGQRNRMPTYRTAVLDTVHNNEELRINLDILEERRECVAIHEARAKLKMTKYYNTRVRGINFRHGDFVYRSNEASHAMDGGKLGPKWEGPYEVTEALKDEAYKLRSMDGTILDLKMSFDPAFDAIFQSRVRSCPVLTVS
nr:reverse transcriptase domain-containing protein [Tanacetum cinerariifolium]